MRGLRALVVFVVAALVAAVLPVLPVQAQAPGAPVVVGERSPEQPWVDPASVPVEGDGSAALPDLSWEPGVVAPGLPADAPEPMW